MLCESRVAPKLSPLASLPPLPSLPFTLAGLGRDGPQFLSGINVPPLHAHATECVSLELSDSTISDGERTRRETISFLSCPHSPFLSLLSIAIQIDSNRSIIHPHAPVNSMYVEDPQCPNANYAGQSVCENSYSEMGFNARQGNGW